MFPYCPLPIGIFSICSNAPPFIDYFDYIGFLSFISNQFSCSVVSNSLRPNGLQHARLPCPSPTPRACSNSCPSSRWYHPTISSSLAPSSSCLQSFPASGLFLMSRLFDSGGQSIGVFSSSEYLGLISFRIGWFDFLAVQGLLRVFSNTTVQKHQLFST